MLCPNCGKNVPDDSRFCDGCGFSLAGEVSPAAEAAEPVPAAAQQPYGYSQVQQPGYMPPVQQTVYAAPPVYPVSMVNLDAPLSVGSYMLMTLVQAIPVIGFIMLLVWAFSKNSNTNRKNYAKAALIWWLIGLGLTLVVVAFYIFVIGASLGTLAGSSYYY